MMQGWMGEHPQQPGAAGDHANAHAEAQASAANAHVSAHSAAQAAAEDAHTAAHAAAQAAQAAEEAFAAAGMPKGSGEEYLQRVGDFVAAALDPLGIDVQVDVETPGGQRTTVKPSAKTDKAEEDKQDKAVSPEASKEGSASSSDDEEWTVLSDKKASAFLSESTVHSSSSDEEADPSFDASGLAALSCLSSSSLSVLADGLTVVLCRPGDLLRHQVLLLQVGQAALPSSPASWPQRWGQPRHLQLQATASSIDLLFLPFPHVQLPFLPSPCLPFLPCHLFRN